MVDFYRLQRRPLLNHIECYLNLKYGSLEIARDHNFMGEIVYMRINDTCYKVCCIEDYMLVTGDISLVNVQLDEFMKKLKGIKLYDSLTKSIEAFKTK